MRLPRDISAQELMKSLLKLGYQISRQKGSHIRLFRISERGQHNITIPNHNPIKVGTLANILNDVSHHTGIAKKDLLS